MLAARGLLRHAAAAASATAVRHAPATTMALRLLQQQQQQQQQRMMATYYAQTHEYLRFEKDGDEVAYLGVSEHAAEALGDVVYVEIEEDGAREAGETIGSIESVKAASDIYAPVAGQVVGVNDATMEQPETVNEGAEKDGWLAKFKVDDPAAVTDSLMDAAAYQQFCDEES